MSRPNRHKGSSVRSLLEELGESEEVEALTLKKTVASTLGGLMQKKRVTKSQLAKRMGTSRSQLDAILDAEDPGLTLVSLSKISFALGVRPEIKFVKAGDLDATTTAGMISTVQTDAGSV